MKKEVGAGSGSISERSGSGSGSAPKCHGSPTLFFPIFFMGTGDDSDTAPRCLGSSTGSNQAILEDSIKWDISKGVAETVVGTNYRVCKFYRVLNSNSSDVRFEA